MLGVERLTIGTIFDLHLSARLYNNTTKKEFTVRKNGRWIVIAGGPYNNPTSADFQDQFVRVSFPPLKFVILVNFVSFSHLR